MQIENLFKYFADWFKSFMALFEKIFKWVENGYTDETTAQN